MQLPSCNYATGPPAPVVLQPHDDDDDDNRDIVDHDNDNHDIAHNPTTHIDRNIDTLDIPISDLLIPRRPDDCDYDHDYDVDMSTSTNTSGLIIDAQSPARSSQPR